MHRVLTPSRKSTTLTYGLSPSFFYPPICGWGRCVRAPLRSYAACWPGGHRGMVLISVVALRMRAVVELRAANRRPDGRDHARVVPKVRRPRDVAALAPAFQQRRLEPLPCTLPTPEKSIQASVFIFCSLFTCSLMSARSSDDSRSAWTLRNLARLRAAISSASSICFL